MEYEELGLDGDLSPKIALIKFRAKDSEKGVVCGLGTFHRLTGDPVSIKEANDSIAEIPKEYRRLGDYTMTIGDITIAVKLSPYKIGSYMVSALKVSDSTTPPKVSQ